MLPKISVLMPSYNASATLLEAVLSMLNQTHHNFELMITDDASTDDSIASISSIQDSRVRLLRHESNLGAAAARNTSFRESDTGSEFVALMDSDDVAHPERLERQVAAMVSNPAAGLVSCHYAYLGPNSDLPSPIFPQSDTAIRAALHFRNVIPASGVLVRRRLLGEMTHLFNEDEPYRRVEDYELWLRMSRASKAHFVILPERLISYRLRVRTSDQVALDDNRAAAVLREHLEALRPPLHQRALAASVQNFLGQALSLRCIASITGLMRRVLSSLDSSPEVLQMFDQELARIVRGRRAIHRWALPVFRALLRAPKRTAAGNLRWRT